MNTEEIIFDVLGEIGRYPNATRCDDVASGEAFREELLTRLILAVKEDKRLIVDISGTSGYSPVFIRAAFHDLDVAFKNAIKTKLPYLSIDISDISVWDYMRLVPNSSMMVHMISNQIDTGTIVPASAVPAYIMRR